MSLLSKVQELAAKMQKDEPCLRKGKCLFNALYEVDSEFADELRGDDVDPFYCYNEGDRRVQSFLAILEERK